MQGEPTALFAGAQSGDDLNCGEGKDPKSKEIEN
jgi:hypothetical protein